MIYFLYGPDSYRRQEKLAELVLAYRKKYANADILFADLADDADAWRAVADFLNQPSMFVDSKVAVVRESGEAEEKKWIEALKAEVKSPKTFVLIADGAAPKRAFQFLLKKPVRSQEFAALQGAELAAAIKKEAVRFGIELEPEVLKLLARAAAPLKENALWFAAGELRKLALAAPGGRVRAEDLRGELRSDEREEVFVLARAMLSAHSSKERLVALERALAQNAEPAYLFNSLGFQSRGIAVAALAAYDVAVKSGKLEYEEALLDFALSENTDYADRQRHGLHG